MTAHRATVTFWLEHALFAIGFSLGLWALLMAAQTRFYASLPIPRSDARIELPGDGSDTARPSSATTRSIVRPGEWVARLEAPSVGLAATVIEGSTDDMLARAAGHIEGTPLPGTTGNVGIAGHRDSTFRAVRNLKVGDTLRLTTGTGVFDYRIERTWIVNPGDVYVLDPTPRPALTLVTCYPFTFIGHAPKRYIVRAELTDSRAAR
jgi:sortase A